MKLQNDNNDKHVDLCRYYEKMNEKERETLIRAADRLFEAQLSIRNDKSSLSVNLNRE